MGKLGWTERQALSADINSATGALRAHNQELLEVHFPEVARRRRLDAERAARKETKSTRFRAWVRQHNILWRQKQQEGGKQ